VGRFYISEIRYLLRYAVSLAFVCVYRPTGKPFYLFLLVAYCYNASVSQYDSGSRKIVRLSNELRTSLQHVMQTSLTVDTNVTA
jgi:hypothetical protein